MRLYHSTSNYAVAQIMQDGFKDGDFAGIASGVFFSDRPLDAADGVASFAEAVIAIECTLTAVQLDEFEVIVEGRPPEAYREWLIPAELVNQMPRSVWSDPELD
jgi:hypothetical protein